MSIEVLAIIGLDPISTSALDNLRSAAEVLRRYGIKMVVIPHNTWSDSINSSIRSLPIILIGGVKAFSGYAPSVKEIVDYVLNHVKQARRRKEYDTLLPAGIIERDPLLLSVAMT